MKIILQAILHNRSKKKHYMFENISSCFRRTTGKRIHFASGSPTVDGDSSGILAETVAKAGLAMHVRTELVRDSESFLTLVRKHFPDVETASREAFLLTLSGEGAVLVSRLERGLFYAANVLVDETAEFSGNPQELSVFETPVLPERGLKLYLPPPTEEGFREFYRIVDFAASCKYNFLMLELGGALEYLSHPEINEGWREYAADMRSSPGRTLKIQNAFPWRKNSIHSENGGGMVVSQKEFLKLTEYCRRRFFEIVPEMPFLSHRDYLLTRHRELAERPSDPYPDTCCPKNPEYQHLCRDLLDEVIALLHPARINICHDEFYSIGLCPRCAGIPAPELYADDVNRIADYLKFRGIKPVMWGEKLLDSHWLTGEPIGGAAVPETEKTEALPATWPALDKVRDGIEIFHWYWGVDRKLEEKFASRGFDYCFANFNASDFKDWRRRASAPHARGVCISNWGTTSMRTLQRNGVLYDLVYASFLLWNSGFSSEDYPLLDTLTRRRLYRMGKTRFAPGTPLMTVCHTVETDVPFKYFFDGFLLNEKDYHLGDHVFRSVKSGREYCLPVILGSNITGASVSGSRSDSPDAPGDKYYSDGRFRESAFETLTVRSSNGVLWSFCRYSDPCPGEKLEYLGFRAAINPPAAVKLAWFASGAPDRPDLESEIRQWCPGQN